eukprot:Sdes_comp20589_c0_seq2m15559
MADKFVKFSEEYFRKKLSPDQYNVCRLKGTEKPFSGKYYKHKQVGNYHCIGCDALLFTSEQKFDSGCGWPSFFDANSANIELKEDKSHNMVRTEALCKTCGCHLGHCKSHSCFF